MYSCNGRERLYACHVVMCRRISLSVKWNKERYSHMNSGVSSIIFSSGSCYTCMCIMVACKCIVVACKCMVMACKCMVMACKCMVMACKCISDGL